MRTRALALSLLLAAACDGVGEPPAAPAAPAPAAPRTAPDAPAAATSAPLPDTTALKDLEAAVASTPPLENAIAPPAAPVPGLPGAPGPSPAAGPATALVHVVVFTDFQCPVCRRIVEPLKLLARRYPTDVRVVIKHAASPRHARAEDAAVASLAALRQSAFWAFFDRTFVDQRRLDPSDLLATAGALGLDLDRFRADLADEALRGQVRYETALAEQLGLSGTPSFVVNGRVQRGWGSYAGLEQIVSRELARARTLVASGIPRARVAAVATRAADATRGPALAAALFPGGA